VTAVFSVVMLFGAHSLTGQNSRAQIKQSSVDKATAAFIARLKQRIANSSELQQSLGLSSNECVEEVTVLVIADLALQQAQHDYDVALEELDECLNGQPIPDPVPEDDPESESPTAVKPTNGEFSVLVR